MQINVRYHVSKFSDWRQMLDPMENLTVGAMILRENFEKFGDWATAIHKYHSYGDSKQQQQRGQQYRKKVYQRCIEQGISI